MTVDIKTTEETLVIADILVNDAYQRVRSRTTENRMSSRGFSDLLCDRIVVGRRTDGSMWVVDGQTRMNVAKKCGRETIAARVFDSRGLQHEAEMFVELNNNRRAVKAADHFKAAVEMGEHNAVAIKTALDLHGLKCGYGKGWPNVTGIAKLRDAQEVGILYPVLQIITKAWHNDKTALQEKIIGALVEFLTKFPTADINRCITRWKKRDPDYFLRCSDVASASGGNRYKAIAMGLMADYNSGLRTTRLEW